jgi:hypothetical protein
MQVFHTAGVPPSRGNSIFATIGWTEKSNAALTNNVMPNKNVSELSLGPILELIGSSQLGNGHALHVHNTWETAHDNLIVKGKQSQQTSLFNFRRKTKKVGSATIARLRAVLNMNNT